MDGGSYHVIIPLTLFNRYRCVEWCFPNIQPLFSNDGQPVLRA